MTRAQLITAVAALTSPNYEVDVEVYKAIHGEPEVLNPGQDPDRPTTYKWLWGDGWQEELPNFTHSVDVMLEVIHRHLGGLWWIPNVRQNGNEPSWNCTITRINPTLVQGGIGTSMARALLVAFLKALP